MSHRDYERGLCDGRRGTYNPPHANGLLGGLLFSNSKAEMEDRKDYDQGYGHGRRGR